MMMIEDLILEIIVLFAMLGGMESPEDILLDALKTFEYIEENEFLGNADGRAPSDEFLPCGCSGTILSMLSSISVLISA